MYEILRREYERTVLKRDEVRASLRELEKVRPHDAYSVTITRDRLAYWEGRAEGLKFALDQADIEKPY